MNQRTLWGLPVVESDSVKSEVIIVGSLRLVDGDGVPIPRPSDEEFEKTFERIQNSMQREIELPPTPAARAEQLFEMIHDLAAAKEMPPSK